MATAAKNPAGKTKQSPAKPVTKAEKAVSAKAVAKETAPSKAAAKPAAKPAMTKKPAPGAVSVQPKATSAAPAQAKPVAKVAARPATPPKAASHAAPAEVSKTSVSAMKAVASKPSKKTVAKTAVGIPANDAELLAMPEEDYMNEAQLAYFKNKLLRMREEILENARETGEHLKENEVFADPNDRATVEEENLLEQRVRDRERKLLKKIDAALERIEKGEYGYCLETGEPIGLPRLLARPTAELSIEAQEKHERMERLYAD